MQPVCRSKVSRLESRRGSRRQGCCQSNPHSTMALIAITVASQAMLTHTTGVSEQSRACSLRKAAIAIQRVASSRKLREMKLSYALTAVITILSGCAILATCALPAMVHSTMPRRAAESASVKRNDSHAWLLMFLLSPLTVSQSGGRVEYEL
jgi:hypothetical protein